MKHAATGLPPAVSAGAGFVAREILAYALQGALLPVRGRAPRSGTAGPTVLLLHGHASGPGCFLPFERGLRGWGFRRFASFEYPPTGSLDGLARRLDAFVRTHLPEGELAVVGHSLGGVLARLWLQEHDGARRTRALVTLSTPHGGLPLRRLTRRVPLVGELASDGPLMRRLERGSHRLDGMSRLSIVSERDHLLRDPERARFPGAELVVVDQAGHAGLLFSRSVQRLVARHLADAFHAEDRKP